MSPGPYPASTSGGCGQGELSSPHPLFCGHDALAQGKSLVSLDFAVPQGSISQTAWMGAGQAPGGECTWYSTRALVLHVLLASQSPELELGRAGGG